MREFLQKMKESLIFQLVFFVVSMAAIFVVYFLCVNKLENEKDLNRNIAEDAMIACDIVYSLEENKLSGWVIKEGVTIRKSKLILKDVETGEKKVFSTVNDENEAVQEIFLKKISYGKAGFESTFDSNDIAQNRCYEIIFALSYTDGQRNMKLNYSSGKYLYEDKIYFYNPIEFVIPEFVDEDMKNAIEYGEVKLYSKEQGIYIYQYEDMFYYIATENFPFAEVGKTHISYHVRTSQNELLPKERQQYKFDNLDFRFENNELKFFTEEKYRVAVAAVPSGYPVISIHFAIYDDMTKSEIWGDYFR